MAPQHGQTSPRGNVKGSCGWAKASSGPPFPPLAVCRSSAEQVTRRKGFSGPLPWRQTTSSDGCARSSVRSLFRSAAGGGVEPNAKRPGLQMSQLCRRKLDRAVRK